MRFPCVRAVATTRHSHWRYCLAHPSSDVSLPRKGRRVGLCIVLFEACSAFTRVTARTLALPPMRGTLTRRLQTFRHLHACSGCFRLERLPGGIRTHWKAPPFHGAHPKATFKGEGSAPQSRHRHWVDWMLCATGPIAAACGWRGRKKKGSSSRSVGDVLCNGLTGNRRAIVCDRDRVSAAKAARGSSSVPPSADPTPPPP